MMGSCDVLVKGCNSLPLCPIPLRDEDLYIDGHISTISTKRELPFIAVVLDERKGQLPAEDTHGLCASFREANNRSCDMKRTVIRRHEALTMFDQVIGMA